MRKDEQFFADESRMGREDKPKVISGEADLELASQKFEADKQAKIARNKEKLNKKGASGYTGGKGLRDEEETAIADNSDKNKISKEFAWWKERRGVIKLKPNDIMEEPEIEQEEIVQAEPEGNNLEKLKKEESELSEKLQQLPKSNPREPLSEEKKEIIAKLEQNREMQDIMAETKQTQTGSEEAIEEGGIKTDSLENIKDIKREESPVKQGKQPKVFQQQHLTEKYFNDIEEKQRREKENKEINDLRERIKNREKNMPDKIGDALIEKDLEKSAEEIKERAKKEFPEIVEIIEDEKKGIKKENAELKTENAQLKEAMKEVNEQLFAIEDKLGDKIIEISAEEDKEKARKTITAIKKFLSKPKVKLAITVGLMGAAYTAGGGAPVILALKPLLAKIGIGYIPYAYGISSWGGGAIAGASGRWFAEKIGLVKNKKDARDTIKEFAMDLKGAANNENIEPKKNNLTQTSEEKEQKPTVENNKEINVAKIAEFVQEAKKKGTTAQELLEGFNNDIKLIDGTIEAIKHEMSIFAFSKKKRDINAAHKWLREKRDEIKKLKLAENAVKSANESSEPVKIGVGSKVFTRNTDGNLEELILGKEITGEPEKPEEKEASQEDIKKYQKDRVGEFDAFYSEAANNKFDGEKIYKFFKKLDNLEKKEKGSEVTTLIRNEIDEKYDKAIVEKMKAAAVEYEKGQGVKKEMAGAGEPKKGEEKKEEMTNLEMISSEVNEMENLIIGFQKGDTSGKELLEYVKIFEDLHKKYSDEEVKPLIDAIQKKTYSFDEKTRGQIVDAMVEYAQDQKIKPSEVLDYVTYFENIGHIGKIETYRWLTGNKKEAVETVQEKTDDNKKTTKLNHEKLPKLSKEAIESQKIQIDKELEKTQQLFESKKQFVDVEIFERVLKNTKLLAKKGNYEVAKNINSIIEEIFDSKNEPIQQRLRKIREIGNIPQLERLFPFVIDFESSPEDILKEYNKLTSKISASTGIDTLIPKKFLEKIPELIDDKKLTEASFILAAVEDMLRDKRLRKLREIGF